MRPDGFRTIAVRSQVQARRGRHASTAKAGHVRIEAFETPEAPQFAGTRQAAHEDAVSKAVVPAGESRAPLAPATSFDSINYDDSKKRGEERKRPDPVDVQPVNQQYWQNNFGQNEQYSN